MLRPIPLALLALALAAPAGADGLPPPEGVRGYDGPPRHARPVRRTVHPLDRHAQFTAAPAEPVYYAWPESAEVRVPIYNRPTRLPGAW